MLKQEVHLCWVTIEYFVLSGGDRKVFIVIESLMQRSVISVRGYELQNVQ